MQPINILHVISKLPVGGVENQLLMILGKYDRGKLSPIVCSLSDKGEIGREIEEAGIEVIPLNKLRHTFDWTMVKDIYNLIKKKNVKIVRTHLYHANLYGRLAARIAKVPCIVASVHDTYTYTMDKKLHRRIINKCLSRFTDKIVAVSEAVKKDILKYDDISDDKIIVIHNGIDKGGFQNINRELIRSNLAISPEVQVIGMVGRLSLQKGQKYLLKAVSKIRDRFPKIVLLIVGDGPLRNELESYARSLDIMKNTIFLGSRRDIPAILSSMDIFVFPSLWEGLPSTLIEAMAAGKPIIATDITPNKEIINSEKVGILVPAKNSDALASSIDLLLHNKDLSEDLGKAAKERAFSHFNIKATVDRYTTLFENILRGKGWNI